MNIESNVATAHSTAAELRGIMIKIMLPIPLKKQNLINSDTNDIHMPVSKITKSTPDEIHLINLIPDLTEEEHLVFAGMCG
jgi:hypothetical protein